MAETMKVHPDCPNASNPYHECGQYCTPKITEAVGQKGKKSSGPVLLNAPRSFDRRIKESKTQLKPRQVPHSVSSPMEGFVADVESRNVKPPAVFPYPSEICIEDAIMPDSPEIHPTDNFKSSNHIKDNLKADKVEQNGKHHTPLEMVPSLDSQAVEDNKDPAVRSLNHNFSGITLDSENSDEEEVISMISDYDSRVWVGKYHVKANISSVLQAIFDKHGDIAANCQLESLALRAYYLECVCFVVQELQTTPTIQLTNAKLKEMLAILKDVESVKINVGWLRRVLTEIIEIMEPIALQRAIEAEKASTKKELEGRKEELAAKEKEVANVKAVIEELEARLSEIELESSEFKKNHSTIRSKVENFDFKALLDELL